MELLSDVIKNPSGWDSLDNYVGETEFGNWYVLMTHNRDSETLIESNWAVALEMLGGESDNVAIHRFGHWACGWWEALCVRGDTPEYATAQDIERRIEDYPVLDEEHFSNAEFEEFQQAWDDYICHDFEKAVCRELDVDDIYASVDWYSLWCDWDGGHSIDDADPDTVAQDITWDHLEHYIDADELRELKQAAQIEATKAGGTKLDCRWIWDDDFDIESVLRR